MTKKKKNKRIKKANLTKMQNMPTPERGNHSPILVRNNIAQIEEPLRIDKLLKAGIIDEMQHLYGMQIVTLWTIASRPLIKTMQFTRLGGLPPDLSLLALSRMSAEDQYNKTIRSLRPRERELVTKICIEEMAAIEAGKMLKLPINSITVYVRSAFDALGNALAKMRDERKKIEEQENSVS